MTLQLAAFLRLALDRIENWPASDIRGLYRNWAKQIHWLTKSAEKIHNS